MPVYRVYKVGSPYNASELSDVDYVQSFDVMYLAHLNHPVTKLVRGGHTDWKFIKVSFAPTVASPAGLAVTVHDPNTDASATPAGNAYFPQPATYVVTAIDEASGQESRASNAATGTNDLTLKRNKNVLTWAAVTGASRYLVYRAYNEQAFELIGETAGTTFTDDNIDPEIADGPPEGANPFADGDNPSTLTFFDQRLFLARTRARPNAVYASRTADFENMDKARPLKEDDAISFALAAQKVNAVNSLVPMGSLLALTGDAVFVITGANGDYISASPPPRARRQSGRGANRLKPAVIDEVVFYRPSIGSEVRTLGFTFEIDGYQSSDISIFSPRLFKGFDISAWSYSEEPLSVLWSVRSDGKMPALTWQKEQQVWGWTLCETAGLIEDVTAIPEAGEDRLYMVVKRTINGVERRFLERMASAKWKDVADSCYLDCAKSYIFTSPTQVITGLHHLEGATVDAIADGFTVRGKVVANASIDLGFAATKVTVGLPYEALIETLPLVFQSEGQGWVKARKQMLGDVVIQVVDTRGIEVGPSLSRMFAPKSRGNEALGTANALITGSLQAATAPTPAGESTLFIRSTEPLPMTVTAAYLDPIISET